MRIADQIQEQVQALPERMQEEVLDFVGYLSYKLRQEDRHWSALSLRSALRGMEDEEWPEYTEEDFKERWR